MDRTMFKQLFWVLAGTWNIVIALFLWNSMLKNDKKTRNDKILRFFVGAFGVGYVLIGYFDWLWWIGAIGLLVKLALVLDYFTKYDYEKMRVDMLTVVVVGDLLWVFAFGAMLGLQLSASRSRI